MQSILMTLLFVSLGVVLITIGFVFGMDEPQNKGKKWTDVIMEDLWVRVIFWIAGISSMVYAGVIQFW